MANELIPILISVIIISLFSLTGAFALAFNKKLLRKILLTLTSFAAGVLLAVAFFDLLPEAVVDDKLSTLSQTLHQHLSNLLGKKVLTTYATLLDEVPEGHPNYLLMEQIANNWAREKRFQEIISKYKR